MFINVHKVQQSQTLYYIYVYMFAFVVVCSVLKALTRTSALLSMIAFKTERNEM